MNGRQSASVFLSTMLARNKQLLRFLATGVLNTVFGYGVYAAGLWAGLPYPAAALVAQVVGACFNYLTYGKVVFEERPRLSTFFKFGAQYAGLYFLSLGILWCGVQFGLTPYWAGAISTAVLPFFSFFISKLFVFRKTKEEYDE